MTLTRDQQRQILEHVITVVLAAPVDSILHKALYDAGLAFIGELNTLSYQETQDLTYKVVTREATDTQIELFRSDPLPAGYKGKIHRYRQWVNGVFLPEHGMNPSFEEWMALDGTRFDMWRTNMGNGLDIPNPAPLPNASTPRGNSGNPSSTSVQSAVAKKIENFDRGTKRSAEVYPILKMDQHWDSWNGTVLALADSHDVFEVFDVSYEPPDDEESQSFFRRKQTFVFTVFDRCLRTPHGRTYLNAHRKDRDARSIYKKLLDYYQTSTAAELERDKLLRGITTSKLDSNWPGTTEEFLLHWQDQVRKLEELQKSEDHWSDEEKKVLLRSAVAGVPDLLQIRHLENITKDSCGPMSFAKYVDNLMSAACNRDSKLNLPARRSRRTVNNLMFGGQELWEVQDNSCDYGWNDHGDILDFSPQFHVHQTQQVTAHSTYIEPEIWNRLPPEAQAILRKARSQGARPTDHGKSVPKTERRVNAHVLQNEPNDIYGPTDEEVIEQDDPPKDEGDLVDEGEGSNLLAYATGQDRYEPGDIRHVLATSRNNSKKPIHGIQKKSPDKSLSVHKSLRQLDAMVHDVQYVVSASNRREVIGSLVDRGANGGLAGNDVRVLEYVSNRKADITGIDDHTVKEIPLGTVAGVAQSQHGPVVLIMHQYAILGKGRSIHSCCQMEHFKVDVNDKSERVPGGKQCLQTIDGYVLPLQMRHGLPYLDIHPPTDLELADLPHVVLTSDADWDPSITDNEVELDEFFANMDDLPMPVDYGDTRFDEQGNYLHRYVNKVAMLHTPTDDLDDVVDDIETTYYLNHAQVDTSEVDFEALRPCFAYAPAEVIKRTWDVTTRWARCIERYPFRKHFKSRFPALNVHRRREAVATDTVYSDTPAIDSGGVKVAQLFVGLDSLVTDIYPMRSDKDFVNVLEDNIRRRGAMDQLVSDRAQVEISNKVKDILRNLFIGDYQSEPHHQHQNPAERRYQTVKTATNTVLDRTGAPAYAWLLALMYVCYVLNHTAVEGLGWQTPLHMLTGVTTDISAIVRFQFWEPVYYATGAALDHNDKPSFPSETAEGKGRFVGFGEHVGDALTFKVLTDDTQKVIYRSYVRSALDETQVNRRLDPTRGEQSSTPLPEIVKTPVRIVEGEQVRNMTAILQPDDIINRTYLTAPDESGQRFRAKIVKKVTDHFQAIEEREDYQKFLVQIEGKEDEVVAYNDILSYLEDEMDDGPDKLWRFKDIVAHEGPLRAGDPSYKGSKWNVMVLWEDGSQTFEPLKILAADCPVLCARYAKDNGLLDVDGWKQFKSLAKSDTKMLRQINQARLNSIRRAPIYKYGFRVPRDHKEAVLIDKENGNTRWQDATALELSQLMDYETFREYFNNGKPPEGYQKIRVHYVYDVKHDGRHKARLVAGGHLTAPSIESVYSGVVSLRSLRMVIFLAELNGLDVHCADVGNAYLEAWTKEKVYIVAPPGFGDLEGKILIIQKALYGLRTSGKRWHERLADTLRDMGFEPSKADPDVWMRKSHEGDVYEYICVYVDDLAIAAKDPKSITDELMTKYKFKLKGVGPIETHLGCQYGRDEDGTLFYGPRKYISKMMEAYERMFGVKPRPYSSPLEKNDHPEMDSTPELENPDITIYQSLIGTLQWVIAIGRFDILTAIMTMSRFRAQPRKGHLDRLKRIYGYLRQFDYAAIRIRTGEPDYSDLGEDKMFDWAYSVYGNVKELIPEDIPEPLGLPVVTTTYVDANLYHDYVTGRAASGVIHLLNGTPVEWFSKRQGTVETATYGSEFVAARIATEQVIDLRITLRYLGVAIKGKSIMFGDNESVITSSTIPSSLLNKRHNALAYHRVREAIAAGIIRYVYVPGKKNIADVLSKHCGYQDAMPLIRPILFWKGDPTEAPTEVKGST